MEPSRPDPDPAPAGEPGAKPSAREYIQARAAARAAATGRAAAATLSEVVTEVAREAKLARGTVSRHVYYGAPVLARTAQKLADWSGGAISAAATLGLREDS